jgi:hypothetical protein
MMECLQGKDTARIPKLIAEAERLIPQKSLWEDNENE